MRLLRARPVGHTCCFSPHGVLPSSTGSRAEPFGCTQFAAGAERAGRAHAEARLVCNIRDCVCIGSRFLVNSQSRIHCCFSQTLGPLTLGRYYAAPIATDQPVITFRMFLQLDGRPYASWRLEIRFRHPGTVLTLSNGQLITWTGL